MAPRRPARPTPPAHPDPPAAVRAGASIPAHVPAPDEITPPTRDRVPAGYAAFLAEVTARVRAAHLRTAVAVNRGLVALYWELGREVAARQARDGWGADIVNRLADDLRRAFPQTRGFTRRNLYYARAFYLGYPPDSAMGSAAPTRVVTGVPTSVPTNVQQAVAHAAGGVPAGGTPADGLAAGGPPEPLASLPWGHNILLLEQLGAPALRRSGAPALRRSGAPALRRSGAPALRLWYARQAVAQGWSRNVLGIQVESRLHARLGRADQTTNFAATLPPPLSDLARAVVKDPYNFEFLAVAQSAHERHVEAGLIAHMREFLLELGTGFLYAGNQYRLVVGGREFFLDLLFYHKRLRCWVVLDLKTGAFEPEYAGKMHFYPNVVDDQLRDAHDQPSIGLILCKSKDAVVAEYALRGVASPVGVAEYRVTDATEALPAELRAALPSLEAVRAELEAAPLDDDAPNDGAMTPDA